MSYLLESLGRGLAQRLHDALASQLPAAQHSARELEQLACEAPTSLDLALRLGVARLAENKLSAARLAFERALQLEGGDRRARLGLACVHDALGQVDLARRELTDVRERYGEDASVTWAIGLCEERRGARAQANEEYRRATREDGQLRGPHERLAALAIRRRQWAVAQRHYSWLAEQEPGSLDVLLTLATLQLQRGEHHAAVETFQRALLIEPDPTNPAFESSVEVDDDALDQTVETLERLIQKYPGVTEFHVHLADLYGASGADQDAVAQYRAALELNPGLLEATVKLGAQHLRGGRRLLAAEQFSRAVELNDRLLLAFIGLGLAQRAAGAEREADSTFTLAVSLAPNSALLYSETSKLCLGADVASDVPAAQAADALLLEARRRHEQAIELRPGSAEARYRLGLLARQLGDRETALREFERAAELSPYFVKALLALGVTQYELGRGRPAIAAFMRALAPSDESIDACYDLALLYSQKTLFDISLDQLENAPAAGPMRDNLLLTLQQVGAIDRTVAGWEASRRLAQFAEMIPQDRLARPGQVN